MQHINQNDQMMQKGESVKDNRAKAIRTMDKLRLSMLLEDISQHKEKYPKSKEEWLDWLNAEKKSSNIYEL